MSQSDIINSRQIQWFPGHMTKTLRLMEKEIRNVDCVLQILDARIPLSSLNPEIERITAGKPHLYVLNKADLADPDVTARWVAYFRLGGDGCLAVTSKNRGGVQGVKNAIETELAKLLERRAVKGMAGAKIRVMVVGIPNVGKSTFINSFAGKAAAKTGNKPGVTKGNQWIRLNKTLELLDTPGILWPKFEDPNVGLCLAFIGSINDEILDKEELAAELIKNMSGRYGKRLEERYGVTLVENTAGDGEDTKKAWEILREIARARSCLLKGSELDTKKAAGFLLDDFRSGKLGRVTLEVPEV